MFFSFVRAINFFQVVCLYLDWIEVLDPISTFKDHFPSSSSGPITVPAPGSSIPVIQPLFQPFHCLIRPNQPPASFQPAAKQMTPTSFSVIQSPNHLEFHLYRSQSRNLPVILGFFHPYRLFTHFLLS